MKKVLIIFGGASSEYEVSLRSAKSVIDNIPRDKYDILTLGITKSGEWFLYAGDSGKIESGEWVDDTENLRPALVSPDTGVHGIVLSGDGRFECVRVDVVFPVLHGKNGEDGTIQGLLQLAGLPFVGCDMLSSAMGMDKAVTNAAADFYGIPQAKWLGITGFEYNRAPAEFCSECERTLGFPMFVKPANAGSSVGITKVTESGELDGAVRTALQHDRKIVVEQGIDGIEAECAVLGNDELSAPVVGEVVPCNDFYDYDAKYIADNSELHIPARLSAEKTDEVRGAACKVYASLGCSGLSRVDFFVRRSDGAVLFNEINTIPGFTSISMYPKMFAAAGVGYAQLLDTLLQLALERWQ